MMQDRLHKICGVGLMGAAVSFSLLALFIWIDRLLGHPVVMDNTLPIKISGVVMIMLGLGLHFRAFFTLRTWWTDDELCTSGPFRYFRHPMYASWITFICPGRALYLNSWLYFLWVLVLHPIWHRLVKREEISMLDIFGDVYREYVKKTGRFIPKVSNRHTP